MYQPDILRYGEDTQEQSAVQACRSVICGGYLITNVLKKNASELCTPDSHTGNEYK